VIIGAAFGKIVTSLVNDVIMPPIGMALGKVDFSNLFLVLDPKDQSDPALIRQKGVVIAYGSFINTLIEFLIIAFCVFLIIRVVTRLQKQPEEQAEATKTRTCPFCISTVALEARRCAHCTSTLPPVETATAV
jgi:large conductance mechanosensitive channel